jgi:hypothetical protein
MEAVISRWHAAVNSGDVTGVVTDPVLVLGPRGTGPISPAEFADWVTRSGIHLVPRAWHPVGERLMVVEQDATWPASTAPTRVATVFRTSGDRVSAVLRLPSLQEALNLAATLETTG